MHEPKPKKTPPLRVLVHDPSGKAGRTITVRGPRFIWALKQLMEVGAKGLTGADLPPGTAWNRYVHELRRLGFNIECIHERHGGEFPGTHGRFRLRSLCTILNDDIEHEAVA